MTPTLSLMREKFVPPDMIALFIHCEQIGLPAREGDKFMNYFESVGWVVGRTRKPMKSWKGALATWKMNWQDKQQSIEIPSASVRAIAQQASLARIENRLKYISGQSPLSPGSKLIEERKQLLAEKEKCKEALGWIV